MQLNWSPPRRTSTPSAAAASGTGCLVGVSGEAQPDERLLDRLLVGRPEQQIGVEVGGGWPPKYGHWAIVGARRSAAAPATPSASSTSVVAPPIRLFTAIDPQLRVISSTDTS